MSENKYLYAVTRIRALETKLLDRSKIERMIEAKNAEEVIKVLYETDYAGSISEMNGIEDYETVLSKEVAKTYAIIREVSPTPELTDIFLYKYDVHNLKTLLKSSFLGEENDGLLTAVGSIPVQKLKEMVKERDFKDLHPILREGVEEAVAGFTVNPDPQLIDIVLDKCLFRLMYRTAGKNKSSFLMDYISTQVDLINIKSMIRIKAMGLGREFLKRVFLEDGRLDLTFFSELLDESLDILSEKLSYKDYHRVVEEGVASYQKTKSLTRFEKLSDDFLFDMVKKGKYVAFGIEPLVGYLSAKENEVKIIRIIMVGKMNEIPNELIRERLRDVYV